MTPDEQSRYGRQIVIPEIGEAGQEKLRAARVCIAGLGGLGSPAAYYLAAAGIGSLTIVDFDRVALDNLNRQILHSTADLGRLKTASGLEKLSALNPLCRIRAIAKPISDGNAESLVADCDLILDATDNMATRQVLNRASVSKKIAFVYGGIDGFSGMASTFIPGRTPCLECLFPGRPKTPPAGPVGALGPMAALIASIQCVEAIKLIVGQKAGLAGRLLRVDAVGMKFHAIDIDRNPHCRVC